jgi:hypothetical protein
MTVLPSLLAVGGPGPTLAGGWDVAPLVLIVTLIVLMRWAGIQLRARTLACAVAGGPIIDLMTDAVHVSFLTTMATLTLVFAVIALRRSPAR